MGLTWTKAHVKAMVEVLDGEHVDMGAAALAALDAAMDIVASRGKFAVVGQVFHTAEHGDIPPAHESAVKVCLGLFESDTKANDAAAALTTNKDGDRLRTWVVPTYYGTPAGWHKERRDELAALESTADKKRNDKMAASIAKQTEHMNARAEETRAIEAKAGGQGWPCPTARIKRGECKHDPQC